MCAATHLGLAEGPDGGDPFCCDKHQTNVVIHVSKALVFSPNVFQTLLIDQDKGADWSRSQEGERLWNRASNQKVAGSIPGCAKMTVSLGKALHPTFLRGNVPVLTVSRSG